MNAMKPIPKQEFYAAIGPRDIMPRILTRWPYTSEWRDQRTGIVVGKSVQTDQFELREHGTCGYVTTYYIDNDALARVPALQ